MTPDSNPGSALVALEAQLDQPQGLMMRMATHLGVEPQGLVFQTRPCGDASACARDAAATRTSKHYAGTA